MSTCRLEQPSADELREHFSTDGRHGSTYCFQCDLDFDSEESRWQHKQGSAEHPHMCIPCRLDYPDPAQLQQHLTTDERHKGTYCETCNEDFESRFQRVAHRRDNPEVHNICAPCDLGFNSHSEIQVHYKTSRYHIDTFCITCNQDFSSANSLREVWINCQPKTP
jgi:hypothetical protein